MQIYYLINEDCNLQCSHCIRGKKISSSFVTLENFNISLLKIKKYFSNVILLLTGGEPTIHPNISEILTLAISSIKNVMLVTNGVSPKLVDIAKQFKNTPLRIQISLDGDETENDSIRGIGVFDSVINNITAINDLGMKVYISTVVTSKNMFGISKLAKTLEKLNIASWHISPVLPFGNCQDSQMIDTEQWNNFVDLIKQNTSLPLSIHKLFDFAFLEKHIEILRARKKLVKVFSNCSSGKNKIYIYPDGLVYPCTCLKQFAFGNIFKDDFPTIMKSENAKTILNYHVSESSVCKNCKFLNFCNGGCIGMSIHNFGELGKGDIRCPILRNK